MPLTMGFDPEFFVTQKGHRNPIPVCGLLGGTKNDPLPLAPDRLPPEFNYHEDNVVAEIGVSHDFSAHAAFTNLTMGMDALDDVLKDKGLRKVYIAEYEFCMSNLQSPQAQEFGCDPDYDAYTGGTKPRTRVPDFGNFRFAGGHIHLGGDFQCPAFVVALFCDLGLGTRFIAKYGSSPNRRLWYGKAGTYRVKDYGLEYRTLDSRWTQEEVERYDMAVRAWRITQWCQDAAPREIKKAMDAINWTVVRDFINNGEQGRLPDAVRREVNKARALGVHI